MLQRFIAILRSLQATAGVEALEGESVQAWVARSWEACDKQDTEAGGWPCRRVYSDGRRLSYQTGSGLRFELLLNAASVSISLPWERDRGISDVSGRSVAETLASYSVWKLLIMGGGVPGGADDVVGVFGAYVRAEYDAIMAVCRADARQMAIDASDDMTSAEGVTAAGFKAAAMVRAPRAVQR